VRKREFDKASAYGDKATAASICGIVLGGIFLLYFYFVRLR
jgi:hypothetical protein